MQLISYLKSVIDGDAGYVQTHLAKEDLDRVKQLRALANEHDDLKAMQKAGLYIGWTKGDFRTHELADPLNALMAAIFEYEGINSAERKALDSRIMDIWTGFHTLRLNTLIHCL